ncbi:hypothetical protein [Hymenobacter negativus]|uniref:Uncharacterized protein n=1 Tax=Hymenobacter negativus TaxID=2795026 RepID=A0ABS3QGP8_9BACT|nr:hypothetical protein [Hymenobacter negativus]MBO2010411.1 hypothetical protein [Hymenobacter negativus]
MRFRLLLLCLPVVLAACSKTASPVRLDFIGATGLTSGNRTVNASDTLTTRAYAEGNDNNLTHMRITVKYEPTRNPIIYPSPITSYDPKGTPDDDELVFADSAIVGKKDGSNPPRGGAFLFLNKFTARSTSGTEQWQYTATDVTGASAARAFRLTIRNRDSALVYHRYTAYLRPVIRQSSLTEDYVQRRDQTRVFMSLRSGLMLPKYALINNDNSLLANQSLVDLICVAKNTTTVILTTPAETNTANLLLNSTTWPEANRRHTELRSTSLSDTDFSNASTTDAFNLAFTNGLAYTSPFSTTPLAKGQVIAFRVVENNQNYTGLLLVSDIVFGSSPRITCSIKVQK